MLSTSEILEKEDYWLRNTNTASNFDDRAWEEDVPEIDFGETE